MFINMVWNLLGVFLIIFLSVSFTCLLGLILALFTIQDKKDQNAKNSKY